MELELELELALDEAIFFPISQNWNIIERRGNVKIIVKKKKKKWNKN